MEKIQAALEKARTRRGTGVPPPLGQRGAPKISKKAHAWSALKEVSLSGKALTHHRVVTQKASDEATPFDIMRTKILLQMQQNGWKRLAITSPMPKCGKTTMACNLALGLGRQSGLNAMLLDLDLSDPSIGEFIGQTPSIPISNMLSGHVPFAEQAVRIGDNVAISASAQIEADPTSIMLSSKIKDTLDDIQTTYDPDIMIFDMPSILTGDNTRAFLKNVDCAVIIARANETRYGHFDTCEREVAEYTNVLGVVLNAFRTKNIQSGID